VYGAVNGGATTTAARLIDMLKKCRQGDDAVLHA
jgi:hypothetical protein